MSAPAVICRCGASHTLAAFLALPRPRGQRPSVEVHPAEDDAPEEVVVYRQCTCGTTFCRSLESLAQPENPLLAEELVDAIGEALGVDTGSISEARFEAAVEAARSALARREG